MNPYILDLANLYDLKQFNSVLNFLGVTLNLVFLSVPDTKVVPVLDSFLPEDRHHSASEITIAAPEPVCSHCTLCVRDYRRYNIAAILNQIQSLPLFIIGVSTDCGQLLASSATIFLLSLIRIQESLYL